MNHYQHNIFHGQTSNSSLQVLLFPTVYIPPTMASQTSWESLACPSCIRGIFNIILHLEPWKGLLLRRLKIQVLLVEINHLHMWSSSVLGTDSIYSLLCSWNQLSFCNPTQSNRIVLLPKKGQHSTQILAVLHKTKTELIKMCCAASSEKKKMFTIKNI